jgi:hypothetical protein
MLTNLAAKIIVKQVSTENGRFKHLTDGSQE